jgi:polar amino acid transport system permease protein
MRISDIRPTTRKKLSVAITWVVFAALVVAAVFAADWGTVVHQFFNVEVIKKIFPGIVTIALKNTILYTLVSFVIGLILGTVLALMKMSTGPLSWLAKIWIEFFRGLPALIIIVAMAYAVPIAFNFRIPGGAVGAGILGLVMVTSGYIAEIIRSGIQAVPKGQTEAARSLGMSSPTTTIWVILPQAFRIVIPPLTNEFVLLLKDTSLLYIAGLTLLDKELTTFARDGLSQYASATPLIMAALLYLVITLPLTYLVSVLEKKLTVRK